MTGLRFPEELRITSASHLLEAAGTRAHVVEDAAGFQLTIDGAKGEIRVVSGCTPEAEPAQASWPFGMERRRVDAKHATVVVERVFAAAVHPVVVLEWQCAEAVELRIDVRLDPSLRATTTPEARIEGGCAILRLGAGATARLVVTPARDGQSDVDALVAATFSHGRRRAAHRPSLIVSPQAPPRGVGATPDAFSAVDHSAALEHAIRLSLMRARPGPAASTLGALALLGLNDRRLAGERLVAETDPARRCTLAGAWAAWTGDAKPLQRLRPLLSTWLRSELSPNAVEGDENADAWRGAARAFAPALVELLGDAELTALLRARRPAEPSGSLWRLADEQSAKEPARAAAEVLILLHGTFGIAPDAPRGRLRIAPRLESPRMQLTRLTVGDAIFSLQATLSGGRWTLRVEQTAGAAPFTVILEPWLRARSLGRALVDGGPAELDAPRDGAGIRPRVQLVTDHAREVVLEYD